MNIITVIAEIKIGKYFQQLHATVLKLILNYIHLKNDLQKVTQEVTENLNEYVFIKFNLQLQNFPKRKQQAPITLQFLLYTHDSSISYLIQALAVCSNTFSSSSQAKSYSTCPSFPYH